MSYDARLYEYFAYRLHKTLILYVPPILFVCGILGNILIFVVLTRPAMRRVSAYVYFLVLSIVDTIVLFIGLLRLWVARLLMYDIRDQSVWVCKILSVAGYTVSDYSVWLIVAVTIERFIAVSRPLSTVGDIKSGTKTRRVMIVMVILFAILFGINAHLLWTTTIEIKGGHSNFTNLTLSQPKCTGAKGFDVLVNSVWPWVDAVIYSILPLLILFLFNSLIICRVFRANRIRINQLSAHSRKSPSGRSKEPREATDGGRRLTVMLLTVSFAFVITTLPQSAMLIYVPFRPANLSIDSIMILRLIQTISELLMYTNHSINFYLYCATGRKFRHQLMRVLSSKKRKGGSSMRASTSTKNQSEEKHSIYKRHNKYSTC